MVEELNEHIAKLKSEKENKEMCQWCEKRPAYKDWGICKECEANK